MYWQLLKTTYIEWSADRAPRMAASLAYYTTLSIAPLLLVVISVAGILFGREAVEGQLLTQIASLTGAESADAIQNLLANARRPADSLAASIVGVATLLLGAIGVAWELKDALNVIWDVRADPKAGWGATIGEYVTSLALVLALGFVLIVSLVVSASLAALNAYISTSFSGTELVWMAINSMVSLAVLSLLFALIFKFLPDAAVRWRDVWIGAVVTAVLFDAGKILVGVYLGQAGVASAYGAAGSIVIVLIWIYYAAQILLFGAEFTHAYANRQEHSQGRARARPHPRTA